MADLVHKQASIQPQATSDRQLIALWLHGKSKNTQAAYEREAERFLEFTGKPLAEMKLGELQAYLNTLTDLAPATQARSTNAIKSLFGFAHRLGYVQWNVAAPITAPKVKNTLAERILTEDQARAILMAEPDPRNRAMLRLLYAGALRASELCGLRWRDLQPRGQSGQITVFGKGGKTGVVLLPDAVWRDLQALPGKHSPDAPVFPNAKGQPINRTQVWRVVKISAQRVGLQASPHYFRHSHASHAIDRGAPISLVQQTLRHANVATTSRYLHVRPNESSSNYLSL